MYTWASRPTQEEFSGDSRDSSFLSSSTYDRDYEMQQAFQRGFQIARNQLAAETAADTLESYERQAALSNSYYGGYLSRYGRSAHEQKDNSYGLAKQEHWKGSKGVEEALNLLKSELGDGHGGSKLQKAVDRAESSAGEVMMHMRHWANGWYPGSAPIVMGKTVRAIADKLQEGHREILGEVTRHGATALSKLKGSTPGNSSLVQAKAFAAIVEKAAAHHGNKVASKDETLWTNISEVQSTGTSSSSENADSADQHQKQSKDALSESDTVLPAIVDESEKLASDRLPQKASILPADTEDQLPQSSPDVSHE